MKQVINIAIDIETLSLESNAAIVAIAAIPFNKRCPVPTFDNVFEVKPNMASESLSPFYEVINATSCAIHGMHFDMETIQWWSKQNESAKAELLSREPMNIGEALNAFHNYLEGIKLAYDVDIVVWAQGSNFDIPIISSAYRKLMPGVQLPWNYRNVRDARSIILETIETLHGACENPYEHIPSLPNVDAVPHSAWSDAHKTAWSVSVLNSLACLSTFAVTTSDTTQKSSE